MLCCLVFFLFFSNTCALNCPIFCRCNRSSTWRVHDYFEPVEVGLSQDCYLKNLLEVPYPIDDEVVILQLHNNSISTLEIRGFPRNLQVVNLNNNSLTRVGIFEADRVRFLHIKENLLTRIPLTSPSIEYINLNNNPIDDDPDKNLLYYRKLKRIDMKNNKLEILPYLPSTLVEGYFNQNKIKFINIYVLEQATSLKRLFLNDNDIYKIYFPEAFYLSRMEKLGLANNSHLRIDPVIKKWCENEIIKCDLCRMAKDETLPNILC